MIILAKTNAGLVEYVKTKLGLPYVYGMRMEILTKEKFMSLKQLYGSLVYDSDAAHIGKVCCDCSGLISSFTGVHRTSSGFRAAANQVYPISAINQAPAGAIVWKEGHVGVYVGMENGAPYYIAADGSNYGCRKNKLPSNFTHWFLCTDIEYAPSRNTPIEIGNTVTVNKGAVYGGLASTRGKAVSESVFGRKLTVDKLETHQGVPEARLKEIASWIAVNSLIKSYR